MLEGPEALELLAKRMDDRAGRMRMLRDYAAGRQTLPEGSANTREAWQKFQALARTNYGGLIVDALAERIVPNSITVEGDPTAQDVCERVWRDNRMDVVWAQARRDWLTTSFGYLLVSDNEGRAVVTAEPPEQMITLLDPLQPWRTNAACKIWRDQTTKTDTALVWVDSIRYEFHRPSQDDSQLREGYQQGWDMTPVEAVPYEGAPPVFVLGMPGGTGEFEEHTALIDRITRSTLERLVTAAIQAFRQRAIKVTEGYPLPENDENGNKVDYKSIFEAGPGAMWELPEGVEIWESQQTDIRPLLEGTKDDIRQLCAVTRTPVPILMPDATNQSAEGAAASREGLVAKAADRIAVARPVLEGTLLRACKVEGIEVSGSIEVGFRPPAMVSLTERYAAAAQAKAAGESLESVQRNVLGYSAEQISADRVARAAEAMNMALLMPQAQQSSPLPTQSEGGDSKR